MISSARAVIHARTTEREWQQTVITWAKHAGWHVHFVWDSRHSPDGWPDLFLVRGDRAIAMELKSEKGKVTQAQLDWLSWLKDAGVEAWVLHPRDEDRLAEILR